ncbi:MAG: tRNA pseudouridine(55) synthase TruB, partial [Armatimonadota bacterium]
GVLVVAVGQVTRLLPWLRLEPKHYRARIVLGLSTSTEDASGTPLEQADASQVDFETLRRALPRFVGEISQIPPMVSALHHQGRRLHELARAGIVVERPPRTVTIHAIDASDFLAGARPECTLDVVCGGGTYIRTLCADLGAAVGVPAHMGSLRRVRVGDFDLGGAIALEHLTGSDLTPMEAVLGHLPTVSLGPEAMARVDHGNDVDDPRGATFEEDAVVLLEAGRLRALARASAGRLQPFRVFPPEATA